MNEIVLKASRLAKHYGKTAAVDGIDLNVARGEIFGLLGPNGAGKTTTILMLLGLTECDGGAVTVAGFDPRREPLQVKRRVGYLPDSVGFYDNLTARENLRYTARLAGLPRASLEKSLATALARVELDAVADQKVSTFSRGMKQRLGLAEVVMKGTEMAILDEPTSGLDPQATFELLDIIRGLKSDGTAVLLSSHLLDRVQAVCDRVALFHRGKIVLEGTVPQLAQKVLGAGYAFEVQVENCDAARLKAVQGVQAVTELALGSYRIHAERDVRPAVARAVVEGGGGLLRLDRVEPSLDMIYRRYFEAQHGTA